MDPPSDLEVFKDTINSMKRVLRDEKITNISCSVFNSALATIDEICTRKITNIETRTEIKYNIDELKRNFKRYEKFISLPIGSMYHETCIKKVDVLDELYTNFNTDNVVSMTKKRVPIVRSHTFHTSNLTAKPFRTKRLPEKKSENILAAKSKPDKINYETKADENEEAENYVEFNSNYSTDIKDITESVNENAFVGQSTNILQNSKLSMNAEETAQNLSENLAVTDEKSSILRSHKTDYPETAYTATRSLENFVNTLKAENELDKTQYETQPKDTEEAKNYVEYNSSDSNDLEEIVESINNAFTKTKEFTTSIQCEKNGSNSSKLSNNVEKKLKDIEKYIAIDAKLKEGLPDHTKEIENEDLGKQHALKELQDDGFVKFPQTLTEMLISHQQVIREEFAEQKNRLKNMEEALLVANKDLLKQIETQENTINLLKSDLHSLKAMMEKIVDKKDEEIDSYFTDRWEGKAKCKFCSNQINQEKNENEKPKVPAADKVSIDEDSFEEI